VPAKKTIFCPCLTSLYTLENRVDKDIFTVSHGFLMTVYAVLMVLLNNYD